MSAGASNGPGPGGDAPAATPEASDAAARRWILERGGELDTPTKQKIYDYVRALVAGGDVAAEAIVVSTGEGGGRHPHVDLQLLYGENLAVVRALAEGVLRPRPRTLS